MISKVTKLFVAKHPFVVIFAQHEFYFYAAPLHC